MESLDEFVQSWWRRHSHLDVRVGDLYDLIEAEGIHLGLESANHEARRVSLGKKMHQFKNRKVGMFYIRKGRRDQRSNVKPLAA